MLNEERIYAAIVDASKTKKKRPPKEVAEKRSKVVLWIERILLLLLLGGFVFEVIPEQSFSDDRRDVFYVMTGYSVYSEVTFVLLSFIYIVSSIKGYHKYLKKYIMMAFIGEMIMFAEMLVYILCTAKNVSTDDFITECVTLVFFLLVTIITGILIGLATGYIVKITLKFIKTVFKKIVRFIEQSDNE